MPNTKQVIVMRTDLNMRKGKMIAQGAHASIAFLSRWFNGVWGMDNRRCLSAAEMDWLQNSFTKICVRADSEEQLKQIMFDADRMSVACYPIVDSGATEFHGVPTLTCCSIGPDWNHVVDLVTGGLVLL